MWVWLFDDFVFFDVILIDRVEYVKWNEKVRCVVDIINYICE